MEGQFFSTEPKKLSKTEYYDFTDAVTKALAGDQEGFETLYWKSIPLLEREARKYCGNPADVEDALQEVYLRIYEKLDTLQDPKRFLGWALTICNRTLLNRIAYEERHHQLEDLRPDLSEEGEAGMDLLPVEEYRKDLNPEAYLEQHVVTETVQEILETLPENQQFCLFLWNSGYSYQQIAEELSMPLGTVKSNLRYGKDKVTKSLTRMEREGTFDYHEVATSPTGAFLYLLERYLAGANAVPPSAGALLPKVQESILRGDVPSKVSTAPVKAGVLRTAWKRFTSDTATAVTSVLLVLVVAIGTALGVQNLSAESPVAPQEPSATRVSRTSPESTTASTTTPGEENAGTNSGGTTPAPATNTATVPAPAPAGNAASANAGNTNPTTVIERPTANAGNENAPLVASLVDVSEVPNAGIINSAGQLGADIADNLTVRDAVIYSEIFYLGDGNETGMYLYLLVKNYLGKDILVQSIPSLEIKSLLGRKLIDQMVRFEPSVSLKSNEEKWFRIVVPYDKLDDITRTQLESNLFQTTYDFAYMEQ